MKKIRRGDIIYVDLGQHIGCSIQSGTRPCLVVSNDVNNKYSKNLCVCPFSAKLKENPVHVRVRPEDVKGYFEKESDCLTEQLVTVSKDKIICKVGHIPEESEVMEKINGAMSVQLGLTGLVIDDKA